MKVFAMLAGAACAMSGVIAGNCDVDLGLITVGVGAAALNLKNATADCGASGSGTACQGDLTTINDDLAKVTTELGNAGTDCTDDWGSKCVGRVANLTATVAVAAKAANAAQGTCDKNEKTLCSVDLIDASLNIAKAVIEGADALGDCKQHLKVTSLRAY